MRLWASLVPVNFLHQLELVEAEQARCLGRFTRRLRTMSERSRMPGGMVISMRVRIAAELAAEFYLSQEDRPKAKDHLLTAYYSYQTWGAKAKLKALENRYPRMATTKARG